MFTKKSISVQVFMPSEELACAFENTFAELAQQKHCLQQAVQHCLVLANNTALPERKAFQQLARKYQLVQKSMRKTLSHLI